MSAGGEDASGSMPVQPCAILVEILLIWVLTAGVWLATLTDRSPAELAALALGTLPCAIIAPFARRANGGRWRFRRGWLRWVATVAREVPAQAVRAWAYGLGRTGRAVIARVSLPAENESVATARRAAAVLALGSTPGTVVLDSDSRGPELVLHRIGRRPGRLEASVPR